MRKPVGKGALRPGVMMRVRLLVALVAFCAYLPAFWWGAPTATAADRTNAWGVDDEPPLGPLAQAHDILHPKQDVAPNLGYPMLHPFMVLGAFTPYMGYLYLTRQIRNPTVAFPHGFSDPAHALRVLTYIAHFLSLLLAVGVVLAAHEIGRVLWDEASGLAAAAAALLVYPMFYYARNSNVDMPVLFFTAVALVAFAHILRHGVSNIRLALFGTLVGLAVATKEPAFASFVFAPIILPFLRTEDGRRAGLTPRVWGGAVGAAMCAFAAYALGSGMIVDHVRWLAHIDFVLGRMAQLDAGVITWVRIFPVTVAGDIALAGFTMETLARALGWPGLALGVVGVIVAARYTPRAAILSLSAVGYLVILS
ncbi:MAG: glycosyltransferase family 39 protein, partial [Gemmatimonadaceae bacterium]